jgi:aminopeptidase YwaD
MRLSTVWIWAGVVALMLVIGCGTSKEFQGSPGIAVSDLREHVRTLASEEFEGRKSGERGNEQAARYISSLFRQFGLQPGLPAGSYDQEFSFISRMSPDASTQLQVTTSAGANTFLLEKDIRPYSFTADTLVSGPLVFAGYGITDSGRTHDDYEGLDVKGKIVVVFRNSPDGTDPHSPFANYATIRVKAFNAREHGAAGLIIVTGPLDDSTAGLANFSQDRTFGSSGIALISMRWTVLDRILVPSGRTSKELQQQLNESKKPASFDIPGTTGTLQTKVNKIPGTTANVIGYLEGSDSVLKKEYVVLGAHFDHLGYGGDGSGSLLPDTTAIHFGADDNASGSSGLLELAQYFASQGHHPRRTLVFAAFSGEELGVLGSNYYVQHPPFPLEQTVAMINMDMIGRMKESTLVVEGMGTSPKFEDLLKRNNHDSTLILKLKPDGYGPSDHASFYSKNIPVVFFFTNLHGDYHKPSDTWDKIRYDEMERVVGLVSRVTTDLADATERPQFTKVQQTAPMTGGMRASLGIVPDYAEDTPGLKISGTRTGSAAEKAGLLAGDIIIKMGGKDVKSIYDLTFLLGEFKPGDHIAIVVKRGSEEVTLQAVLDSRK